MKSRFYPLSLLLVIPLFITGVNAAGKLSPGLDHIAAGYPIAKAGLIGAPIPFEASDFADALGLSSVGSVTVTSLPDPEDGVLTLGTQYVSEGQTIREKNLSALRFLPKEGAAGADFGFTVGDGAFERRFHLYCLDAVNQAPTFSRAVSTLEASSGVMRIGSLGAADPENDPFLCEIVRKPRNGILVLTDRASGSFTYTPTEGFTGRDSFEVRAVDCWGGRSPVLRMTIDVSAPPAHAVFADTDGHWAEDAVITCITAGILDKAKSDADCFYPDHPISRAEFLSLIMNAAGYTGFRSHDTGFDDDAAIPAKYKGSIALAEAMGVVKGVVQEGQINFCPNNQITRAEAALMISRLTGITASGAAPVFAGEESVPAWAASAMTGLYEAGILRGNGHSLDAYAPLTRGAAAQLAAEITRLS